MGISHRRRNRQANNEKASVFSTSYSPQFIAITGILKRYLPVLLTEELMSEVKQYPKRAGTIGNIVSPSMFAKKSTGTTSWLSTTGFHKYGYSICRACSFANVGRTFLSTSIPDQPPFNIASYINCNSRYVIYLITC